MSWVAVLLGATLIAACSSGLDGDNEDDGAALDSSPDAMVDLDPFGTIENLVAGELTFRRHVADPVYRAAFDFQIASREGAEGAAWAFYLSIRAEGLYLGARHDLGAPTQAEEAWIYVSQGPGALYRSTAGILDLHLATLDWAAGSLTEVVLEADPEDYPAGAELPPRIVANGTLEVPWGISCEVPRSEHVPCREGEPTVVGGDPDELVSDGCSEYCLGIFDYYDEALPDEPPG